MTIVFDRPTLAMVPDRDGLDDLAGEIIALAGRLAAATCRWLLLVAQFDAAHGCRRLGLPTTARWLAHTCGLSDRTATDHVRVARALAAHPTLADGMSAGRLSYSHVRAISRVVGPDDHDLAADLVGVAEHGTVRHLESMVRGLRTVRNNLDGAPPPDEAVSFGWTPAGQWRMSARHDPERGALVERAVRLIAASDDTTQAEAFIRLAEIGLAALADGGTVRELRGDELAAVVIHVDASRVSTTAVTTAAVTTVSDGSREPSETEGTPAESGTRTGSGTRTPFARIADGPGLPTSVVERLLCAARVRPVVRDGPEPFANVLDLGRTRRLVSMRQLRALLVRQQGRCAHPGCAARKRLHAHHVEHWLYGGRTNMANLVLLCEPHHLAHHEGEYAIEPRPRGRFRFVRADGLELVERWDPSTFIAVDAPPVEVEHAAVADGAATTRWRGERLDHRYAVSVLAQDLRPPA